MGFEEVVEFVDDLLGEDVGFDEVFVGAEGHGFFDEVVEVDIGE